MKYGLAENCSIENLSSLDLYSYLAPVKQQFGDDSSLKMLV